MMATLPQGDHPLLLADKQSMCYCPGCSHAGILERLGHVLEGMNVDPHHVCIVSDIGCVGTADRYFDCHTFHGLHGRSITYAEGIKRVRPETLVIVLIGDGGCGIGTAHLVHAARRNADIKVLVFNNFNFGMTGGQASPTTFPGGTTGTTPGGAVDRPMDICQTVIANGASHAARVNATDKQCASFMEAALRAPGFALVDIWELCTAYFLPRNKLKPTMLDDFAKSLNMPMGLLRDAGRPVMMGGTASSVPSTNARRATAPMAASHGAGVASEEPKTFPWSGRKEIWIAGSAGQRIRSAAGLLGEMATVGNQHAAQSDDFPITVRKGHSVSQLIVSDKPIRYLGCDHPDLLIVLSEDGVNRLGDLSKLPATCRVAADASLALNGLSTDVIQFDYRAMQKEVGAETAAWAMLVRMIVQIGWIDAEALRAAANASLRGAYRDKNLAALNTAIEMTGNQS
ncbi:MAG: 2-oxoacid:acceptor oxidoreductase family protein [Phycisphaerales bacterium]|nr:2-oxoacid:acceptor oxidoreductase family protein [Phycisphaerales bacterium]MCB9856575.1 2-oxoacid:acceptor oxidoreductase family protein [Phycisphaerales bacterium]MCB9864628.1 2-oxoacid:acceptor oxidoreductase family protein [Phycisphaerales bacterium]